MVFVRLRPMVEAIAIARIKRGKREKHIGEAHQDFVDDPAGVPGDRADQRAEQHREGQHEHRDLQRHARAGQDAAEDIAAQLVRAEDVRGRRSHQLRLQ